MTILPQNSASNCGRNMFQITSFLFIIVLALFPQVSPEEQKHTHVLFSQRNESSYTHISKVTPKILTQVDKPSYILKHSLSIKYFFPNLKPSSSNDRNSTAPSDSLKQERLKCNNRSDSVIIVYPENQKPPTQPCNPGINDFHSTIPPSPTIEKNTIVAENSTLFSTTEQSTTHINTNVPLEKHSPATPLPIVTASENENGSSRPFTSPQPTPTDFISTTNPPCFTIPPKEPIITSPISSTSTKSTTQSTSTKSTTQSTSTAPGDKHTTIVATNPTQVSPTTFNPWATSISTNKPTTSSTPPITSNPTIKDPTGELQCLFNGLYPANNYTCDQYLVCINGVTYLMNCPNGLAFNDQKKSCDWPGNVNGCNPRAFENFACPYKVTDEDGSISTFRYRNSCSQFVACYRRKPRLLNCMDGFFFDENSKDCVYFKHVTNCEQVVYSF